MARRFGGTLVSIETEVIATDKADRDQFVAGWLGLAVCGLVAAVIWFFAVKSVWGETVLETSALDCASTYGVDEAVDCARA